MATVQDYKLPDGQISVKGVAHLLTSIWNFPQVYEGNGYTDLYINEAKTIGIRVSAEGNCISIIRNGTIYHATTGSRYSGYYLYLKLEATTDTFIISAIYTDAYYGDAVIASNCHKYIICNAKNTLNETEPIVAYVGSNSSSNVSAFYTNETLVPTDMGEQNGGANVNAKYTAVINLYNIKSNFVAINVYKSMFMELSAWSFGDVMLNGHRYRMSGPIFALDE